MFERKTLEQGLFIMDNKLDLKAIQKQQNESLIDTTKQKEADKKAKRKRERDLSDIRKILSLPEGRRYFWRLIAECGAFHDPYVFGDDSATARNTGRLSIGLNILNDLTTAKPDIFTQLRREHLSELDSQEEE